MPRVTLGVVEHVAQRSTQLIRIAEHLTGRHVVRIDADAATRPEPLGLLEDEIVEVDQARA